MAINTFKKDFSQAYLGNSLYLGEALRILKEELAKRNLKLKKHGSLQVSGKNC